MKQSNLKADVVGLLVRQMAREGLPQATREYRFHPLRRWKLDLAYPKLFLAFEYEGGIFSGGAHTRGKHFQSDCEKYNTAALMGWRVFRLHGDMIFKGQREMDEGWKLVRDALIQAAAWSDCLIIASPPGEYKLEGKVIKNPPST